jgi:uncharacterized protein Yka (UPF0111/DUF47 family)
VAKLFSSTMDPITLLKQKEIIELLEHTTDLCEDVADVIQNVAVKNGWRMSRFGLLVLIIASL